MPGQLFLVKRGSGGYECVVDSLAVGLSKILYGAATEHPATDTATMLLDVELLKECAHCDGPTHVRVCKTHLDRALVAIGETLEGDEQLLAAGDNGQYVGARLVADEDVPV